MQRGHTRRTASACRPDSGRMSSQSTCGYRPSRDRLSASPQRDWFVPGAQACTSPPGRRTPSGSTHSLDAATAYLIPPLCTIGPLTSSGHQRHELAPRDSPPSRQLNVLGGWRGRGERSHELQRSPTAALVTCDHCKEANEDCQPYLLTTTASSEDRLMATSLRAFARVAVKGVGVRWDIAWR